MTLHRNVALLAMFFTGSSLSSAPSANGQSPAVPKGVVMVKAGEVQWQDYPGRTGVKLAVILGDPAKPGPFIMRVRFPEGYRLPAHTHPAQEHTTILSGALRIGYGTRDDGSGEILRAGSLVITPADIPHFIATAGETVVQTHAIGPWASTPVK